MQNLALLIPIILPVICGILVRVFNLEDRAKRQLFVGISVAASMLITVVILLTGQGTSLELIKLGPNVSFSLAVDTMSVVFGCLVSVLWVFTTFYAFGYMSHEGKEVRFFTFFTIAMGVTMGLALSATPVTMYLFYELLTFITYPLVTHSETPEAMKAGRKYLMYSIGGASLAFISIAVATFSANTPGFALGGMLGDASPGMLFAYMAGFLGFGVKAAVFPLHGWLPSAHVAPTPVTALLHAVAVVKAGIFGILRTTYYVYGATFVQGSWAQYLGFGLACITVLYGSTMALRTTHLKKRLAYSTVSQLSYILVAGMMCSAEGLRTALIYMVFHAVIKITLFFGCGSVMFVQDETDVRKMSGVGKLMPMTMLCFMVASLGLAGIPPTAGFIGKVHLALAAANSGNISLGSIGLVVLMISTLLTALYLLPLCAKAFFPGSDAVLMQGEQADPMRTMSLPVLLLAILVVVLGIAPGIVSNFVSIIQIV